MLNKKFFILLICILCLPFCFAETEPIEHTFLSTLDTFSIWNHTSVFGESNLTSSNINDITLFNTSGNKYMNITHNLRYVSNLNNLTFTWWTQKLPLWLATPDYCAYSLKIYCRNTTNNLNLSAEFVSNIANDAGWYNVGFAVDAGSTCDNASKNTTLTIPDACINYAIENSSSELEFWVLLNSGGNVVLHPLLYTYNVEEEIIVQVADYKQGAKNVLNTFNIVFTLIALAIIVGAAFLLLQVFNNGADVTTMMISLISFVGLGIIIFIGYVLLSHVYTAI